MSGRQTHSGQTEEPCSTQREDRDHPGTAKQLSPLHEGDRQPGRSIADEEYNSEAGEGTDYHIPTQTSLPSVGTTKKCMQWVYLILPNAVPQARE